MRGNEMMKEKQTSGMEWMYSILNGASIAMLVAVLAAIGIMTVSPAETAIIMADIAMKSSGIELGFVDRFSGSLIITGTVSEVEASTSAILDYVGNKLGFTLCPITRT